MERKEGKALGRPRTIDRDKVLDAAETVVARTGATGLTIDAVAKEAGITKGGVQYCFGTKENLIKAMIGRWGDAFEREVMAFAGGNSDPKAVIRGHIEASRRTDETESSRSAAMMAALLQNPEQVADTRAWYNSRLEGLDVSTPGDRRARLAFLASEGVFFLKTFALLDLDEEEWQAVFDDIRELAARGDSSG